MLAVEILRSAIDYITKLETMLHAEGKMTKIMAQNQMAMHGHTGGDYLVTGRCSARTFADGLERCPPLKEYFVAVDGRKRTSLDRLSRIVANIAGEEGVGAAQQDEQQQQQQEEAGAEGEKKLAVLL
ncbi:unnamed protein product [Heligmosomoides polygyrus]|uniref:BHLH domain-containing protein n=1 Tax=Heligmosomoides polygyrus TaxID=6339 RepID=A0A3P7UHD7_HELPZ|nr:unnamed protein product [Heligmosomoides polygyrus]